MFILWPTSSRQEKSCPVHCSCGRRLLKSTMMGVSHTRLVISVVRGSCLEQPRARQWARGLAVDGRRNNCCYAQLWPGGQPWAEPYSALGLCSACDRCPALLLRSMSVELDDGGGQPRAMAGVGS
ncbi:hypothetical protein Dimus_005486 [Dionaea muscipula]